MAVFAENNKFLGIHALSLTQSHKDLLNNNSNSNNKKENKKYNNNKAIQMIAVLKNNSTNLNNMASALLPNE